MGTSTATMKGGTKAAVGGNAPQSAAPAPLASLKSASAFTKVWADNSAHAVGEKPIVFVNGQLLPKSQAMVSVYDHGLLYGDGVFEGIRVYRSKIFKCEAHMERLYRCAAAIGLKIPVSRADMVQIQRDTIAANALEDGYIRLVVSRGYGTLGLDPRRCPVPGVICIADQIRLYSEESYREGMKVVIAKRPKNPVACLDPRIKSLNYLNNILAKVEAIDAGCDEAIMLSQDGYVTECTGDNIFIVKKGELFTPPSVCGQSGLLEGVTRAFVMKELSKACGVKCSEKLMRLDEVLAADEVFLTGTAAEIIAVHSVGEFEISKGEGPITKKLRTKFREIVTSEHIPED